MMNSESITAGRLRAFVAGVYWLVIEVLICAAAVLIYLISLPVLLYSGEIGAHVIDDMRATFADLLGHEQRKPPTEAEVEAHLQRETALHLQELEREHKR
jgi:hypothetical protein